VEQERFAIPFVKALVLSPDRRRFLLQRRAKEGDPYEGFWELPGGKMRLGETAEAALGREVREETGLRVTSVLGQKHEEICDHLQRRARLVVPLVTAEVVTGPMPFLGHYFVCLAAGTPMESSEGDRHRLISPRQFEEEFLRPGSAGRFATLDLLAMRIILREGRLAPFLQSEA